MHKPASIFWKIVPGHTISGATPTTVTVNEHWAVFPDVSVVSYVTIVSPIGNVSPLPKLVIRFVEATPQLSEPTGAVNETIAPAALVATALILFGQEIVGFSNSVAGLANEIELKLQVVTIISASQALFKLGTITSIWLNDSKLIVASIPLIVTWFWPGLKFAPSIINVLPGTTGLWLIAVIKGALTL